MSLQAPKNEFRAAVVEQLENTAQKVIELTILWQQTVLRVLHLPSSAEFSLRSVGPETSRSLVMDAAEIPGGGACWQLVEQTTEGPVLVVPAGAAYSVQRHAESTGLDTPASQETFEGSTRISLQLLQTASCTVGGLRFQCKLVHAAKKLAVRKRHDRVMLLSALTSALIVASVLTASWRLDGERSTLLSNDYDQERLAELLDFSSRTQNSALPEVTQTESGDSLRQSPRGNDPRPTGSVGSYDAPRRQGRSVVRERGMIPQLSRVQMREQIQARGIFAAIGVERSELGNQAPQDPFGGVAASGHRDNEAWGNLQHSDVADAFGYGGLGRIGVDQTPGGGGSGEGTICGDGPSGCTIGTMGYGQGSGAGIAMRRQAGALRLRERITRGPFVCGHVPSDRGCGEGIFSSQQSAEVIRRVIHRNMGQVQHCYERALQRIPSLEGRVTVRFVYATDGVVMAATPVDNSTDDTELASCIVGAFRRFQFPVSDGVVTATYPITLRSE